MKYLSIRVKLMILTLIILIPLIILQVINIQRNLESSIEEKLQSDVKLANVMSSSFCNYVKELWVQELLIGNEITAGEYDTKKIQSSLDSIKVSDETALKGLSWISPEGIITASSNKKLIGQPVTERVYYNEIIGGEDKVIGNLIESYDDMSLVVPVARAIKVNGKLTGILVSGIYPNDMLAHIPDIKLNDGEKLAITDSNGNMVYNTIDNTLPFKDRKIPENAPTWKALNGEFVKTYKAKTRSSNIMGVEYPIAEIGWACSVISDRDIVLNDINRQTVKSIIILIFVLIMSIVVSYILGKKITEPLVVLKNKAYDLKQGDYSVRTNIKGYDEIAATAEAFDHMADSIEQYDKLKSQFFSNLSHEFKTPINVIYSSIQLIESLSKSSDHNEFKTKTIENTAVIRQNCYRLMRLVDNMIDVTRYDTGNFKMKMYNVNIVNVIENITSSVVNYAENKGVTIIFDTEFEEKKIFCDPNMIERIILNLISNSLKFTDVGGFVYINLYDKGEHIIVSVKDTGIGMPMDKLNIIFDRFRQVDTSLSRNQEGSGLGLSIVKALVEAHNGSIAVTSELGIGTEFFIELPVTVLDEYDDVDDEYLHSDTIQKIAIEFSDIYSI